MFETDKIIELCRKGDRAAQKELYERFSPKLFAVCLRYSKNRMEAEDYLHEGFMKIFAKIDQFKHQGPLEAWMRRIMVNTILEAFRKNSRMPTTNETRIPADLTDEENEDNDLNESADINEVLKLIEELPEKYRIVLNLYVLEDFSHEEIARQLGISVGTSKSNLSRARQWLKKRLGKEKKDKITQLW